MNTIELSAALGQAQVVENLKNFVGVDAQGAAALMTPERLAAVAGGKMVQKTTAITDCDQLLVSGVYYIHQEILNAPFGYAFIVVFQSPLEPSELVQVAYGLYLEQKKRTKIKDRGWSEWR